MSTLTLARGEKPPVDPDDIEYVNKTSFVIKLEAEAAAPKEEVKEEKSSEESE